MSPPNQDRDVLGYGDEAVQQPANEVLKDHATGYGVLVAQATPSKPSKQKPAAQLKTTQKLLITDGSNNDLVLQARKYAEFTMKCQDCVKTVMSWDEFIKLLQEYKSIDHLVIDVHSYDGGLILNGSAKDLSELADLFSKSTKPYPTIKQIDFDGCNVARKPDEVVTFAKLFNPTTVTGWTHFHIMAIYEIEILDVTTVKMVNDLLAEYKDYFVPGTPEAGELVKQPGKHTLLLEWFRNDMSEVRIPPPDALNSRSHTFKTRKSAGKKRIKSDEAVKLREKYERSPLPPFEQVIITF